MGASKRPRLLPEQQRIHGKAHAQADIASEDEVQAVSPCSKHRRSVAELKVCTASYVAAKESFRKCNLALQSARKGLDDAVAAEAHSGAAATKVVETVSSVIMVAESTSADANKRLCQEHFLALNSDRCTNLGPHISAILQAYEGATGTNREDQLCTSFAAAAQKRPPLRNANDSAVINRIHSFFVARNAALGGMPRVRRRNTPASVQAVLGAPRPMCAGAGVGIGAQNAVSTAEAALEEARRNQQASAARLRSEELDQRQAEAEEQTAAEEVAASRCLRQEPCKLGTVNQEHLGAKLQGNDDDICGLHLPCGQLQSRFQSVCNASVLKVKEEHCATPYQGNETRLVKACTSPSPLEID